MSKIFEKCSRRYVIIRAIKESQIEFTTRIANEIQIMDCKIISCYIESDKCTIHYKNRIKCDW